MVESIGFETSNEMPPIEETIYLIFIEIAGFEEEKRLLKVEGKVSNRSHDGVYSSKFSTGLTFVFFSYIFN